MRAKLLQDVIELAVASQPLPVFSDEAAVAAWIGKLSQGITAIVYDAIHTDAVAAHAVCSAAVPYEAHEVEAAIAGKIGDGTILNFLKSVNWAQLIQTIMTIISVIPKTPAPAPAA